jgi:hypothetical protein
MRNPFVFAAMQIAAIAAVIRARRTRPLDDAERDRIAKEARPRGFRQRSRGRAWTHLDGRPGSKLARAFARSGSVYGRRHWL